MTRPSPWRPIATAPRDRVWIWTRIMVGGPGNASFGPWRDFAVWSPTYDAWCGWCTGRPFNPQPTHWCDPGFPVRKARA